MNKTTKKILIWTFSILGIGIIGYIGFVGYVMYTFVSGCGMDDGPFNAVLIKQSKISENSKIFELKNNGVLILDNRTDSLSPTLTLKENGIIKWTLDTDTRNTKGYESTRIWKISNVTVTKNSDPIKLNFAGHWTYGAEAGSMEISRDDGANSFCLSW
ncbi:hypothetical protein [Aequorivita sinensis]|uniref:hypothetical protein n=1 Tax=Aequorivita sinensis TaxID=1382458 RepID=UPI002301F5F5|nr:hypothetical protein [Aequorivita sinensis]